MEAKFNRGDVVVTLERNVKTKYIVVTVSKMIDEFFYSLKDMNGKMSGTKKESDLFKDGDKLYKVSYTVYDKKVYGSLSSKVKLVVTQQKLDDLIVDNKVGIIAKLEYKELD